MKKLLLIIMDGWGCGKVPSSDAIEAANTPYIDMLYKTAPNSKLISFGAQVGLPDGQMGNSEVGHLNIGAGRIVYQELQRINHAIETGEFAKNKVLLQSFAYSVQNNKPLHLIGLVSDGGVHSHISHVKEICTLAIKNGVSPDNLYVHAFTDGRDCDPHSGLNFLKDLQSHLDKTGGHIASVCGRYYAMDRDNRWDRIMRAYDCLTKGIGMKTTEIFEAIENSYQEGISDEFIKPIVRTNKDGMPFAQIWNDDAVICFNFRTDRCREITRALTQQDIHEYHMHSLKLDYTTMTVYDHSFVSVKSIFINDDLNMTLGEWISKKGLTQLRIAETEKYPHVTFFFSGGREEPFTGETRLMVPSPKVATYDLQPEMSAFGITEKVMESLNRDKPDFVCLNFANTDMVGHTGVFKAAVTAAETVDKCVSEISTLALKLGYTCLITADHGNADYMINEDGTPNTAHTKNPVPLFLVSTNNALKLKDGILADIAPTICELMELDKPAEMTGKSLIEK